MFQLVSPRCTNVTDNKQMDNRKHYEKM